MSKNPPMELKEFLAPLPTWTQCALRWDYSSFTLAEWAEYIPRQDELDELRKEYERILRQMPAQTWNAYCDAQKKFFEKAQRIEAKLVLQRGHPGRPPKDSLAEEGAHLKAEGLSWAQIAQRLNSAHGKGTTTAQSIRKLVTSRQSVPRNIEHIPEKTRN